MNAAIANQSLIPAQAKTPQYQKIENSNAFAFNSEPLKNSFGQAMKSVENSVELDKATQPYIASDVNKLLPSGSRVSKSFINDDLKNNLANAGNQPSHKLLGFSLLPKKLINLN